MARTHSKPLTLDEICREAFGVMGLRPWEFDEYTYNEYLQHREGYYEGRLRGLKEEYQHFRIVAYWAIFPHLTKGAQRKSIDHIIPDIYGPVKAPMTAEEFKAKRDAARERIKNVAGRIKQPVKNSRGRSV